MNLSQKVNLKVDWCSYEAAKYAVMKWHYSKTMPKSKMVKIGVWEYNRFIGCILFGVGAASLLVNPYGLQKTEGCELTRIALNEHKTEVTKMLSISLKKLKNQSPKLRLIVSFADPDQGHLGKIYQASNWIYSGVTEDCFYFKDRKGKIWHPKNVSENLSLSGKRIRPSQCRKVYKKGKYRYLYPLDRKMREQIELLRQPYPKEL